MRRLSKKQLLAKMFAVFFASASLFFTVNSALAEGEPRLTAEDETKVGTYNCGTGDQDYIFRSDNGYIYVKDLVEENSDIEYTLNLSETADHQAVFNYWDESGTGQIEGQTQNLIGVKGFAGVFDETGPVQDFSNNSFTITTTAKESVEESKFPYALTKVNGVNYSPDDNLFGSKISNNTLAVKDSLFVSDYSYSEEAEVFTTVVSIGVSGFRLLYDNNSGSVSDNSLLLDNNTFLSKSEICGASSYSSSAVDNKYLSGATVANNSLTIKNSQFDGKATIMGARVFHESTAKGNYSLLENLTFSNQLNHTSELYGAYADTAFNNLTENSLEIKSITGSNNKLEKICGAYANFDTNEIQWGKVESNKEYSITKNKLSITDAKFSGQVVGAYLNQVPCIYGNTVDQTRELNNNTTFNLSENSVSLKNVNIASDRNVYAVYVENRFLDSNGNYEGIKNLTIKDNSVSLEGNVIMNAGTIYGWYNNDSSNPALSTENISGNTLKVSNRGNEINKIENFNKLEFTLNFEPGEDDKPMLKVANTIDATNLTIDTKFGENLTNEGKASWVLVEGISNIDKTKLQFGGEAKECYTIGQTSGADFVTIGKYTYDLDEEKKLSLNRVIEYGGVNKGYGENEVSITFGEGLNEKIKDNDKLTIANNSENALVLAHITSRINAPELSIIAGTKNEGNTLNINTSGNVIYSLDDFGKINIGGEALQGDATAPVIDFKYKETILGADISLSAVKLAPKDRVVFNGLDKILSLAQINWKEGEDAKHNNEFVLQDDLLDMPKSAYAAEESENGVNVTAMVLKVDKKEDTAQLAIKQAGNLKASSFIGYDGGTKSKNLILSGANSASRRAGSEEVEIKKYVGAFSTNKDNAATNGVIEVANNFSDENSRLIGGFSIYDGYTSTGNSLKVTGLNNLVGEVMDFENMNFVLPSETKDGDKMLRVYQNLDLAPTKNISVDAAAATSLRKGHVVTLLESDGKISNYAPTSVVIDGLTTKKGEIKLEEEKALRLNVLGEEQNANTKAPAEGIAAASALVGEGGNFVANDLSRQMTTINSGSTNTFAAIGGGKTKLKSGSHVDARSWNVGVGIGRKGKKNPNSTYGFFVTHGSSKFDTYNNDFVGSGKSKASSLGLMFHSDAKNNYYYEGSMFLGSVKADWHNPIAGGYDDKATYRGFNIGMGKKYELNTDKVVDIYGRFMFAHTNEMHGRISGLDYSFAPVESKRLRLGFRLEGSKDPKKARPFFGLAFEREFDNSAKATMNLGAVEAPSLKGDTGILEVGYKWTRGPWDFNFTAEGNCGKRKGVTGSFNAFYNF